MKEQIIISYLYDDPFYHEPFEDEHSLEDPIQVDLHDGIQLSASRPTKGGKTRLTLEKVIMPYQDYRWFTPPTF